MFAITAILLLAVSASALQLSAPGKITLSNNQTSITLTNDMNVTQNVSLAITTASGVIFAVSPNTVQNLNASASVPITILLSSLPSTLALGEHSATLTATGTNSSTNSTVKFVKSFCSNSNVGGNLSISRFNVDNEGDGDDDSWTLLDKLTVEVRVENRDTVKVDDVKVLLGLIDNTGKDIADSLEFTSEGNEEYDLGSLGKDDEETVTFEIEVPADFDTGSYDFVVKAYSSDLGESKECVDQNSAGETLSRDIEIQSQDDEDKIIAFTEVELPVEATCGDLVTLSTNVVNIGTSDQDEVNVHLTNRALGLNLVSSIRNGLDSEDDQDVNFDFTVPEVRDGNYNLELVADYEDGDSADATVAQLKLIGCSATVTPTQTSGMSITASLDSDAQAGEPLSVTAVVKNTGTTSGTFILGVNGYDSWATLESISQRILNLNAGESKQVTINFNVNKDASGDKSFEIEVVSGDKTETADVSVELAKQSSGFSSLSELFKGNSLIWIVALINIVLIIIIIIVAVRVSRR